MGCTAVRITFVFGIALPDCPAVFAVRVPDLGAEDLTAIAADDFSGKRTVACRENYTRKLCTVVNFEESFYFRSYLRPQSFEKCKNLSKKR